MKKNNKKIVVITGITSYLGRSTAKYLIDKGYIVFGIAHKNSIHINDVKHISKLHLLDIDIDKISEEKCIKNDTILKNYDISILHFAWIGSSDKDRSNENLQKEAFNYSKKVLHLANIINAKNFIFMGSQSENTDTIYGKYKKLFSDYALRCKNKNMNFIHLKIFSVYGYGQGGRLLPNLLLSIKNNENFDLGSCEKDWNFLYIDDFTDIVLRILQNVNKTISYDVGSIDTRKLKDFIIEIKKILKSNIKLNFNNYKENNETQVLPDIRKLLLDIKKDNWVSFETGIKKYFKYIDKKK